MSRLSANPVPAKAALGALLLTLVAALAACEEDGKTAPADCVDPQPYDIQGDGTKNTNPCDTNVGHAVSSIGPSTPSTGGTTTVGGEGGSGTTTTADAGAGGAGGAP